MAPEPEDEIKDEKNPRPLDEDDIALLKTYVSCDFCCLFFPFFFYRLCIILQTLKLGRISLQFSFAISIRKLYPARYSSVMF